MGSTGSGRFSDYPGSGRGAAGGSDGGAGSASQQHDRCTRAFTVTLQDVEHSEYFLRNSGVPVVGTELTIEHRKRIVAVDVSGISVGNLPTSFNYIADCIADGFNYAGVVTASTTGSSAIVTVDFAPVP